MREILFRGKSLNFENYGHWIYGSLICRPGETDSKTETFIVTNLKTGKIRTESTYPVSPETVGQFTGEYDCDDKEIYEGDILEIYDGWESDSELVYIEWNNDVGNTIGGFVLQHNCQYDKSWYECFEEDSDVPCVRVVGNLYDGITDSEKSEEFYKENSWLKSRLITAGQPSLLWQK